MKNKKNLSMALAIVFVIVIALIVVFYVIPKKTEDVDASITDSLAVDSDGNILTAEDIVTMMKAQDVVHKLGTNSPSIIGRIVHYTSETDLNELLGRPNQYTSKSTFEDTRLEQENLLLDPEYFSLEEINEPTGGTVEVFANEADMQKRKTYLETVTSSFSPLVEYSFSKKNVLLRINKQLTPEQANYYEQLFNEVIK